MMALRTIEEMTVEVEAPDCWAFWAAACCTSKAANTSFAGPETRLNGGMIVKGREDDFDKWSNTQKSRVV